MESEATERVCAWTLETGDQRERPDRPEVMTEMMIAFSEYTWRAEDIRDIDPDSICEPCLHVADYFEILAAEDFAALAQYGADYFEGPEWTRGEPEYDKEDFSEYPEIEVAHPNA